MLGANPIALGFVDQVIGAAQCTAAGRAHPGEGTSNRPVGGEIVDVVDEAARGEQRDDLRRRLLGGLFV